MEACLVHTTIDLGEAGKDEIFGWGLIQAENALKCLVETIQCCVETVESDESSQELPKLWNSTSSPLSSHVAAQPRPISSETMTSVSSPVKACSSYFLIVPLKKVMADMESLLNFTETPSLLTQRLEAIFESDIQFTTSLSDDTNAEVDPFFQSRFGVSSLANRLVHAKHNTTIVGTDPFDVAFGDNLMYYRCDYSGTLVLDGPTVSIKSLTKLRFSDGGKISNMLLAVFDVSVNQTTQTTD